MVFKLVVMFSNGFSNGLWTAGRDVAYYRGFLKKRKVFSHTNEENESCRKTFSNIYAKIDYMLKVFFRVFSM